MSILPEEDVRHLQRETIPETFFFAFTTATGEPFGLVRLIFGADSLLETVAIRLDGRYWVAQSQGPCEAPDAGQAKISGAQSRLVCITPWQHWRLQFAGDVAGVPVTLALEFRHSNAPERYQVGAYTQVQQDGIFTGALTWGEAQWRGRCVGYRDHSWGRRAGDFRAVAWTMASIPERLYATFGQTMTQQRSFGRVLRPDGSTVPVVAPQITRDTTGWQINDPDAGFPTWTVEPLAPPLVTYLGSEGREAVRDQPQPDDWARDEFGPTMYTSPEGERRMGFWEQGGILSR